jgi:SAM-dependent methyltransferase
MRKTIYDVPEMYRLTFSHRNVALEASALIRWFKQERGTRKPPSKVLELAAGPADHAIELAKKGINATALDVSQAMCRFARRRAREQAVTLKVVEGDMISFTSKEQYDMVVTMLDSINQIHKLAEMIKHLRSVAACLADDGIYILELADHPKKGQRLMEATWKTKRPDHEVEVVWRPLSERSNGRSHKVSLEVMAKSKRGVARLTDVLNVRTWSAKEIAHAISRAGCFKLSAKHKEFLVLRKLD